MVMSLVLFYDEHIISVLGFNGESVHVPVVGTEECYVPSAHVTLNIWRSSWDTNMQKLRPAIGTDEAYYDISIIYATHENSFSHDKVLRIVFISHQAEGGEGRGKRRGETKVMIQFPSTQVSISLGELL